MKKELVWNVFRHNINTDKIETWNIFKHGSFYEHLYKAKIKHLKKDNFNFECFIEEVKHWLMCYYWSKCEWEVVIKAFVGGDAKEKIDVYSQILNNWDAFRDYLFNNYKLIKKAK